MARKQYSKAEKSAFRAGLFAGLRKTRILKANGSKSVENKTSLLNQIKAYRERNLGCLYSNGKIYDTNFIEEPVEISKSTIKQLRKEYGVSGKETDIEIADRFVRHMRRKYGFFDKNGKFIGMIGDKQ